MIEARKTNVILCFAGKQGTATGTTGKQVEFPTDEPSATTKNLSELFEKVVSVMGRLHIAHEMDHFPKRAVANA